jgi:hypothetical protein
MHLEHGLCLSNQINTIGLFILLLVDPLLVNLSCLFPTTFLGKTKKQPIISRFSVEAEYLSLLTLSSRLQWLKYFVDLRIDHPQPITLAEPQIFMNVPNTLMLIVILFVKSYIRSYESFLSPMFLPLDRHFYYSDVILTNTYKLSLLEISISPLISRGSVYVCARVRNILW